MTPSGAAPAVASFAVPLEVPLESPELLELRAFKLATLGFLQELRDTATKPHCGDAMRSTIRAFVQRAETLGVTP